MSAAAFAPDKPLTPAQRIVHALVEGKGLSPADLSRQLGIKAQAVRDMLRGKSAGGTHLDKLAKFARLMGLSDDDLGDAAAFAADGPMSAAAPEHAEAVEFDTEDAPTPPPPPGELPMRERIKAMLSGKASDLLKPLPQGEEAAGKAMQKRMAETLTPMAALIIVWTATTFAFKGPYARCNPTQSEAQLMVYPLLSALSRRMDAVGALSEDSMDLVLCLGAITAYGLRAHADHQRITEALYAQATAQPGAGASVRAFAGPGGSPAGPPAGGEPGADAFAAFAVAAAPAGNGHARPAAAASRGQRRAEPGREGGDVPAVEHPALRGLLDADFVYRQEHGML